LPSLPDAIFELSRHPVRHTLSDMKTLTMRDLTHTAPLPERKPDWRAHFEWLRRQPKARGEALLAEFEDDRRRLRAREKAIGNLQ
jgi:hypothetical protein